MDITALKAEIDADPLARGYSGMDDAAVAVSLNAVNRTTNKATMEATEVMQAIDSAEFAALSAADKQTVWDVLHIGTINPFGIEATLFTSAFGGGSATITALASLRKNDVSRAGELGLGSVRAGNVEEARK